MLLRMSTLFLRTLREDPADAEVPSHRLLVRAGYVRRVAPGIYSWLPLGYRVFRNVERIDAVTKADIRRIANQIFVPTNRTVGIIDNSAVAAKAGQQ